jgi:glycosyltransferase involved in cell wall biosynthesis
MTATEKKRGSDVLAYTVTYGDRPFLTRCVDGMRGSAGMWFDWMVCVGRGSKALVKEASSLLHRPDGSGIQYLQTWTENRGQHHGTNAAMEVARDRGYKWILRIDDDVEFKTKRWLKRMLQRNAELKRLINVDLEKEDKINKIFVLCPTILRLKDPVKHVGVMEKGQSYDVEIIPYSSGCVRLMPMDLMKDYTAPIYNPAGRGDPASVADHINDRGGVHLRFRDIRVIHDTVEIEKADSDYGAIQRTMSHYWPFLEAKDV